MATHLEDHVEAGGAGLHLATDEPLYLNREVSWLDFNDRVLAQAEDRAVPLLERAKFLAIFSQNLDEFFQVRIAGLKDQLAAGLGVTSPDGLAPARAAQAVAGAGHRAASSAPRRIFLTEIAPALASHGIRFSDWSELDDDDRALPGRTCSRSGCSRC